MLKPHRHPMKLQNEQRSLEFTALIEASRLVPDGTALDQPDLSSMWFISDWDHTSRLKVSSNFSILNPSPMTGLHLGIAAIQHFTNDPARITEMFPTQQRFRTSSFFEHLPARYGKVACLALAVDCVLARLGIGDVDTRETGV